jgi:hypothetical protein
LLLDAVARRIEQNIVAYLGKISWRFCEPWWRQV